MAGQANLLFNVKTIERLCKDVELTDKQKEAAKEWIALLDQNKLEDEKKNYFRFGQIILQDILGFPIKEIDFEADNVEFIFQNKNGKKVVCFEAKGTSTKDLFAPQHRTKKEHETPIKQTWDYMGSIGLDYGICTNYKDFVLISKEVGYYKVHNFNFLSIKNNEQKLKEFVGIFSKERIIEKSFVKTLHTESIIEEREFTKEFYKLFHETRLMLIQEFQNNPDVQKDEAIHYAQIYLNRLIFIFFVEDNAYIPDRIFTNRILEVLKSTLLSEHSKLACDEISGLFKALDKGSKILGVFGFNGGLFEKEIPARIFFSDLKDPSFFDNVKQQSKLSKKINVDETSQKIIKKYGDTLNPIIKNLLIMDSFDFTSEINVNILGHIFEQSISDLEELRGDSVSKRKKDGVFYTPEYITEYICRNTIVPYLSKSGTNIIPDLVKEYSKNIEELENKIKELKILDPACGSGAFLIKAVDILLEIDREIEKYKAPRVMEQFQLTEFSEQKEIYNIIENNIYGVDVNEESIEITKLSLFLKLAGPNRKLISLSKNIKIGNSLVDDKSVDPRAFDWECNFPEVMKFGKFDIVIGNPPYLNVKGLHESHDDITNFLKSRYSVATERYDFYILFVEKASKLVKEKGYLSFILPHKFINAQFGRGLRKYFVDTKMLHSIISFGHNLVFEDSTTYTCILTLKNVENSKFRFVEIEKLKRESIESALLAITPNNFAEISLDDLDEHRWVLKSGITSTILSKINSTKNIMEYFEMVMSGLQTADNDLYVLTPIQDKGKTVILYSDKIKNTVEIEKDILKPVLKGEDVKRYEDYPISPHFVIYPYVVESEKQRPLEEEELKKNYPLTYKYMLPFKEDLIKLRTNFKTNPKYWHALHRGRVLRKFEQEKIITTEISLGCNMTLDTRKYLHTEMIYNLLKKPETTYDIRYFLAVLNSKVMWFFVKNTGDVLRGGFFRFKTQYIEPFSIPEPSKQVEKQFVESVNKILKLKSEFKKKHTTFLKLLKINFKAEKPTKALDTFYNLTFELFLKEITSSSKAKLSVDDQLQWMKQFESHKQDLLQNITDTQKIEDSINQTVYGLYNLTDEEIQVVEENYPT
jgi:SAM-dependent methyltransferase